MALALLIARVQTGSPGTESYIITEAPELNSGKPHLCDINSGQSHVSDVCLQEKFQRLSS